MFPKLRSFVYFDADYGGEKMLVMVAAEHYDTCTTHSRTSFHRTKLYTFVLGSLYSVTLLFAFNTHTIFSEKITHKSFTAFCL